MGRLITGSADIQRKKFQGIISQNDNVLHSLVSGDTERFVLGGEYALTGAGATEVYWFFMSSDGYHMYAGGNTTIFQYDLTSPWDITTASFVQSLDWYSTFYFPNSPTATAQAAVYITSDGLNLYYSEGTYDRVHQFYMTTPWDISTLKRRSPIITPEGSTNLWNVKFGNNGSKLYYLKEGTTDSMYQYSLSTPYDLNTASYDSVTYTGYTSQDTIAVGLSFKSDGTKMYITGQSSDAVYQYSLSTAWDISTASYESKSLSVSAQDTTPASFTFNDDGTIGYVIGDNSNTIYQYTFSVAWDISTGSYDSKSFSVSANETNPAQISFLSDGTKFYLIGYASDAIREYELSTPWDITTASLSNSLTFGNALSSPRAVDVSPDGKYLIFGGSSVNKIWGAEFFTPGDITTLNVGCYNLSTPSSPEDTVPEDLWFSTDGTKMYRLGSNTDSIYQYTLSIPWEVFSATYDSVSFSVTSQDTFPVGLCFNYNGTRMYIIGTANAADRVNEYTLTTPWDLSTASYRDTNLIISISDSLPKSVKINQSGDRLYVGGDSGNKIYQYNLLE